MIVKMTRRAIRGLARATGAFDQHTRTMIELPNGDYYVRVGHKDAAVALPAANPFIDDQGCVDHYRSDAAMSMLDEDCYGFVLFALRRTEPPAGRMDFRAQFAPDWSPAFAAAMAQTLLVELGK